MIKVDYYIFYILIENDRTYIYNFKLLLLAVFATGGRDGHLMVYDARMKEKDGHIGPVNCIKNVHNVGPNHKTKTRRKSVTAKV